MPDRIKNILIGIFVLSAIVVTVSMILFLDPKIGDGQETLIVRFSNVGGISEGTRVIFAGKPVGEVSSISPVKDPRKAKADAQGNLYFYQVTLKLDSSVQVYNTDEITVQTTGLMGEKMVAITPKKPPEGTSPVLVKKGEILYADSTDAIQLAMQRISKLGNNINKLVKNVDTWFGQNSQELSNAVAAFSKTFQESGKFLGDLNEQKVVALVKQTLETLNSDLELVYQALDQLDQQDAWVKIGEALTGFNEVLASFNLDGKKILQNVNVITQNIADGTGTLGKLIQSDDLYLRVSSLMSKANTLMNDLNHYGLLFQYDKGWQRTRTKRANLLEALDTPKEFRSYFETEMDTINTSLSRLNVLMQKAEDPKERKMVMSSEPFKKDFATLLRQVQGLFNTLKLYNEEMEDQDACGCD